MKIFIAIFIVLALIIAGIYVYIPGTLTVSVTSTLHGTVTGFSRALLQKEKWKTFWIGEKVLTPDTALSGNDLFIYNNDTFRITKLLQNALAITISKGAAQRNSTLLVLPLKQDSVALNWSYNIQTSANLFTRIQQYRQALS